MNKTRVGHRLRLRHLLAAILLTAPSAALADSDNYVEIGRGKALATAGDCVACHTAPNGTPFAGGLALQTPFGAIMTPNITPDNATGIGSWSADDFARALHEGRRPNGTRLYPALPYPYYTRVTRADADAIFAYLRSLEPVSNSVNRSTLPFPFNIRASMAVWNALFFTPGEFKPDPAKSDEYNRGAYLVEGLGHCGACHTPLNALGANKNDRHFEGGVVDHWTAPNITNDSQAGLGKWSVDEVVQYLKTGQARGVLASGPMKDVVENSTSRMADADLKAMAVYLKERGAAGSPAPTPVAASDSRMKVGEAIFVDTCAACHVRSGEGIPRVFPKLAGATIATQDDPASLIHVVITGGQAAATATHPTAPTMPSFGFRLSDEQIAAVVTYVRNSWGNAAAPVTADAVKAIRAKVTGAAD
ncbi:gluconate 2-dehydrogenase cytochrome c subunit precursor [Bradyrhizobium oligotrophicum S58]|uniref:Gluconate 2-dehydrogenase cytochrome c subunit n=1 Tax=Bradyrhizobium oligotrophicum S58 TaxID=1245469 RepID=M4ZXQ1_9BRAD|nr:cytochrome c [Bradyrhizobium oligotrophicum]BAM91180.1 gluconate 2-dehydrogenase cytochrome c subunit precursor [Bradyrhizobium oligotrophicum S58]